MKSNTTALEKNLFQKKYSSPSTDKEVMISQNYFINQININNLKHKIEESIQNQREKSQHDSAKSKRDSLDHNCNNSTVSQYSTSNNKRGIKSAKPDLGTKNFLFS